ncbi:hypothetical protein ACFOY2_14565 [Nonomuraea purpurea]|uniref:MFS transporter n=1 Tax=Nonomuraea purpurea TaxID=1849276 RepID=A0ABV8G362_9ACTN
MFAALAVSRLTIVTSPASADSTILIFFSRAICGGLGTMTTSLAVAITPS